MDNATGCIQVGGALDRETVETVIVKALVTDTLAETGPQTATGLYHTYNVNRVSEI